jgi:hypothetical protein
VPLSVWLERAGLEEDACEIVLEGPDRGVPKEGALPPGQVSYARSLPRAKAVQREVLIAYQMNEAEFIDSVQRYSWRRWKFDWVTPKKPGQYTLLSRAKVANGHVQPDKHDENEACVINHPLPIKVIVG